MDKTKLIGDGAKLDAAIKAAGASAKKIDAQFQLIVLSAANHFAEHGDNGYLNRAYLALGKGARHVAMTAWITAYAGQQANTDKSSKATKPFVVDKSKAVDLEGGSKTAWFAMKPSKSPDEVLDVLKLALAMLKKASNPKEGQEVTHAAMLPELQAVVDKFNVQATTADGEGGGDEEQPDGEAQPALIDAE